MSNQNLCLTLVVQGCTDFNADNYDPNATDVNIRFFKDGADNYYVQGNENTVIDLKYRMGTNGSYFNRPISEDLTIDDIPEEVKRPINGANQVKKMLKIFFSIGMTMEQLLTSHFIGCGQKIKNLKLI